MEFKDQFPSLMEIDDDGYFIYLLEDVEYEGGSITKDIEDVHLVKREALEKHCLDKKKVREAIFKMRTTILYDATYFNNGGTYWDFLLKELGLNK